MSFQLKPEELGNLVGDKLKDDLSKLGSVEGLAAKLKSDLKSGLSGSDFAERKAHFGVNELPEKESKTFMGMVIEGLEDKTLIMLIVAALVSLALGIHENPSTGWIEGTAIIIAVAIVVLVGATNNFQKEQQFRALNSKKENKNVKVIRNGATTEVSVYKIMVGDIMIVETGDIISADGVFVSGHGIKCDESQATGESDSISKPEHDPFFLSGSQVLEGYGSMIVVAVGPHSFNGRTMLSLRVEAEDTPLENKLDELADNIGKVGLVFAALTLFCLIIKYIIVTPGPFDFYNFFSHFVKYLITAITMLVVAVPEGLPLAVTISLAYSMTKMLRDNNLVRHLAACETMGGATAVCSDKTGTLTQNRMTVVQGQIFQKDFKKVEESLAQSAPKESLEILFQGISVNSTAYEGPTQKGVEFLGNKTECALLGFTKKLGCDYKKFREEFEVIELVPFSSARKSMASVVKSGSGYRCHVKGASEIVLGYSSHYIDNAGKAVTLDKQVRESIENLIKSMAQNALRTICIAYRDADEVPKEGWDNFSVKNLTVLAILGIQDPLREEVPKAVEACQTAGVVVRMVTGDNLITAQNIAKNCGIFVDDGSMIAMEGPVFRELPEDQFDEILPKLRVLARSSPLDKQILVNKLKERGEIVAVTGDGTNDAPALKLAHVGFSMGIAGTEVAKEASDIILMDDNFSSIVKALLWGRNVFDSIRKFLQFQLTVNIVAVVLAFVGSLTSGSGESPLKPVQLLWVNLIMDTMAALALATEDPTPELLKRKPHSREGSGLITPVMWKAIIGQAIFQLCVNFGLLYGVPHYFGIEEGSVKHLTIFFNTFVLCQVFNEINARKINDEINVFAGFFKNHIFISILAFTLGMQYLIVQYGGEFASTTPLTWDEWIFCFQIAVLGLPVGLVIKFIPVPTPKPAPLPVVPKKTKPSVSAKDRWKGAITNVQRQNSVLSAFVDSSKKKKQSQDHLRTIAEKIRKQNSVVSFLRKERTKGNLSKIHLMNAEVQEALKEVISAEEKKDQ